MPSFIWADGNLQTIQNNALSEQLNQIFVKAPAEFNNPAEFTSSEALNEGLEDKKLVSLQPRFLYGC